MHGPVVMLFKCLQEAQKVQNHSSSNVWFQGAVVMGATAWEAARIQDGRPVAGKELTEQHLPLDAGLYHAVSLNKGCYMGQETLAKVHKLNAVKQQLHGLMLDAHVSPGTPLLSGEHQEHEVMSRRGGGRGGGMRYIGRLHVGWQHWYM